MDLETRAPMRADTLFRIASMTKPIVGVGVMMMVEENKLRLSDPVSRYIPEFRNLRVAVARPEGGSGAAPSFDLVAAQREVTIKDLLTHVSGLGSGPMSNATIEPIARRDGETLADYIPRLGGTALEFQPGTRWAYSPGPGFETLGRVLEIVSGMPLDEFFEQRIFAPLGMRAITFWPAENQWPRVATVYQRQEQRLVKAVMPNDTLGRNVYFRGSGGLYSTAESYVPFGMMLANGGELDGVRLLSPQVRRDARRRARSRHAAGPAARRRLRLERARRHRSRGARHAAVRRNVRLVRRARHALLRRSERAARRRAHGADAEQRSPQRLREPRRASDCRLTCISTRASACPSTANARPRSRSTSACSARRPNS